MTTPAARVLRRLQGVRSSGPGRWIAHCPAHEDRSPSLSIRECDDGRVLIYDFAGCGATEIVAALGLEMHDLFPPREAWRRPTALSPTETKSRAPRIPASDALEIIDREALVVEVVALDLSKGMPLEDYHDDLALAAERISAVRNAWRAQP